MYSRVRLFPRMHTYMRRHIRTHTRVIRLGSILVLQSDARIRMAEAKFSEEKAKMQQKLEQTIRRVCLHLPLSCSPGGISFC